MEAPRSLQVENETGEPPPLLAATGLRKTYQLGQQSLPVLRGVDFELDRGRFVALCGASGAVTSTSSCATCKRSSRTPMRSKACPL